MKDDREILEDGWLEEAYEAIKKRPQTEARVDHSKRGSTPFWWAAIDRARRWLELNPGYDRSLAFTREERELSSDWVTCACGRQDPRIKRMGNGAVSPNAPVNPEMRTLGLDFSAAVWDGEVELAAEILGKIETMSDKLIAKKVSA